MDSAVVLLSGGMDSCVCAAIAQESCTCHFLHVSYGQRTERRELQSFRAICQHFHQTQTHHVRADYLGSFGHSSLTDPTLAINKQGPQAGVPLSYVPFRNGNLLAIAGSLAEVVGAEKIYIGAVEADSSGYPDCRRDFFRLAEQALAAGTKPETDIEIVTPIIDLKKSEIVARGIALRAPLELTWSCYEREDLACGSCDSCRLRTLAFQQAGVVDPLPYKST